MSFIDPLEIKDLGLTVTDKDMANVITNYLNNENQFGTIDNSERKDFMSIMAEVIQEKLLELELSDFPAIARSFLENIQARHIAFFLRIRMCRPTSTKWE